MITSQRGFTVVEAMISLVISVLLVGGTLGLLVSNQKLADAVAGRMAREDQLRAAVDILSAEVRDLDPSDGDLDSTSPDTLRVRSFLGAGVACAVSYAGTPSITLRRLGNWIQPGDSVLILADNDPMTGSDDRWVRGVAGTVDTTQVCPTGDPAQTVNLPSMATTLANDSVRVGASARSFQWRNYVLAMDQQSWFLTVQTADMLQPEPVAGPFAGPNSDGIRFGYFDGMGQPTTVASDVRQFEVSVKTVSNEPGAPLIADSLMAWVRIP
ncbi:MAG: prepilin-type N-terminal cleavage/methylation domain-containing protein [Gemmatimonadota bacterium]|nr:prepilin-type N-terminal cleavage/methylation domain-containing protein [Gemmatimonadota bacterium]